MKKKLLFGFMAVVLVAGTILAGCAAPAEVAPTPAPVEKVYKWKFSGMEAKGGREQVNNIDFCEEVGKMSKGRIQLTAYADGEIIPGEELFEAVPAGAIEVGGVMLGKFGAIPWGKVFASLPFGISRLEDQWRLHKEEGLDDWAREQLKPFNVHLLGCKIEDGMCLFTKEPVYTVDELKGLKVRAFGTAVDVLEALDVSVVTVPWPECYMAAMTGIVDGIVTMQNAADEAKLYEPLKGAMYPRLSPWTVGATIMPLDLWEELPEDLQAILTEASRVLCMRRAVTQRTSAGLIKPLWEKEYGVTFTMLSDEDMANVRTIMIEKVWKELAAETPESAKVVEMKMKFMKDFGYID